MATKVITEEMIGEDGYWFYKGDNYKLKLVFVDYPNPNHRPAICFEVHNQHGRISQSRLLVSETRNFEDSGEDIHVTVEKDSDSEERRVSIEIENH